MAVSPWVLAPEQPNLHRINGFFLENPQNTLDLSYDLMARSYGHLKEKCAIFPPTPYLSILFEDCYFTKDYYKWNAPGEEKGI